MAGGRGGQVAGQVWKRIVTPSGRVELRTVRPGFRSMLDDLATGRANAVLAEDLDRLLWQPRDNEDATGGTRTRRSTTSG